MGAYANNENFVKWQSFVFTLDDCKPPKRQRSHGYGSHGYGGRGNGGRGYGGHGRGAYGRGGHSRDNGRY